MFIASLWYLFCLAGLIHLSESDYGLTMVRWLLYGLIAVYPMFLLEPIAHWLIGSGHLKQHIFYVLIPVLRLGGRDHTTGDKIWLPRRGWRLVGKQLVAQLVRAFSGPMIVIALLVLPVVLIDIFWTKSLLAHPGWMLIIHAVTGFIWMAFVIEFVIVVSVVEKRLAYCRKNWIDVAVILLPLLAFMRAVRLGQLLRLQQISRTARIYRIRGLLIRAWRAIVTLEVIDMFLRRDPSHRLERLQEQLAEKEFELQAIKAEIAEVEILVAEQEAEQEAEQASDAAKLVSNPEAKP